jgi:hypothetical protein
MPLIPHRFLFRVAYPCRYLAEMPVDGCDELFELPDSCRLDNFARLDEQRNWADIRIAWNELGLGFQAEVRGKEQPLVGDADKLGHSDQVILWIDTRDARTSHRASRHCHQLHFLPTGGGPDRDQPAFVHSKINRAQQDAPTIATGSVAFHCRRTAGGYRLAAFLPANALTGFDPEQHPRLGIHYLVRDSELGEQSLSVGSDFPCGEDPTLWSILDLSRSEGTTDSRPRKKGSRQAREEEE